MTVKKTFLLWHVDRLLRLDLQPTVNDVRLDRQVLLLAISIYP